MSGQSQIVVVKFPDGRTVKFEAEVAGGEERVALGLKSIDFDQIGQTIETVLSSIQDTMQKLAPRKASVKFGVKLAVESGQLTALIVKGQGEANLEVVFEWGEG